MWFWWFILICDCIIPVMMVFTGRMMWKHCPRQINGVVGYRTKMSMINKDTWKFAHEYAGKLWCKVGVLLFGPTLLVHIPFYGTSDDIVGALSIIVIVIQLVFLFGTIFLTEKALENNFEARNTKINEEKADNYMTMGMSLGMCFGAAVGAIVGIFINNIGMSLGMCFGVSIGMLVGMAIGSEIKKDNSNEQEEEDENNLF